MKAGIYLGKHQIEIQEIPTPSVGENDVLIQNIYSSICGTDVAVYQEGPNTGHRITIGSEFGHETISRIVKIGSNVKDFKLGQRVYPYPRYAKDDTSRSGTLGGFSEFILIPNAKINHSLYPINENISDKLACLIEPFTVGCRAARRAISSNERNKTGIIFGAGTIGIAAAYALKHFGMEKVMICDASPFRRELAQSVGFQTCDSTKENWIEQAKNYFGNAPSLKNETADIDCWIDAAGADSILEDYIQNGKIESRFVSVAVNKKPRTIPLLQMTYAQQSIIGSGGYMPNDVQDVQEIMFNHPNIEKIITHEFTLDQLEQAIQTAGQIHKAGNVVIKMKNAD